MQCLASIREHSIPNDEFCLKNSSRMGSKPFLSYIEILQLLYFVSTLFEKTHLCLISCFKSERSKKTQIMICNSKMILSQREILLSHLWVMTLILTWAALMDVINAGCLWQFLYPQLPIGTWNNFNQMSKSNFEVSI